ncbi:melibiose:sodium symporter [Staphylococcus schleiferi]|uniref:melibiose:sodium transporter MelB n=1 Tax=Staphylococcus coagulans TaxID=74706 RepID=UPI000679F276|nr:melibiose:sodium transporter MelB [Staphylococcus coagulans]AKS68120.1 melibiose:sodium symporter [Staphylococcus schleiferi]AKS70349.1 melibiose:sodium symporter [Staphylococcus schleiferi]AKS72499.1 melibiose:sodium symporter [Staphylococcus schleiferi]MBA8764290.1 melibiose:sodium transporter MelB [Staphylococcus coagulans]MBT2809750.1 melibiose:sodium transporter MelB [Staphylococcus coagulans]
MAKQVSTKEKYSFGFGAFGKDMVVGFVGMYLMFYFTDVLGVSAAFVGTLFFIARIWDAINDPIMGMIIDNTRSKWGKFRPWILAGTLVNSIFFILLFTDFDLSQTSLYIYVSLIYILWGMSYTMMDVPYWSWLPNLTNDPVEREEVSIVPRVFASTANLINGTFGLTFIYFLGTWFGKQEGDQSVGFFTYVLIITLIFILTISFTVKNVKEAPTNTGEGIKVRFKDIWRILFTNKELLAYIGTILCFYLGAQFLATTLLYYFNYVVGSKSLFALFNALGFMEMVGLIIFPRVAKWITREKVYPLATGLAVVGLAILFVFGFIAPTSIYPVIVGTAAIKLGFGLITGVITVSIADVIDYSEVKFGQRNESIITSTQTFLVKTAMALSGLVIGWSLSLFNYAPNIEQTEFTKNGIRFLMMGMPVIFILISYFIYKWGYKLKGAFLKDIVQTLENRKNREKSV